MSRSFYSSSNASLPIGRQQYDKRTVWGFENLWHSDLLDCHPISRCCFACFCPCCMGCKLAKNMGESSVIGCFPGSWFYLRTKIRAARRIDGSCCGDYFATSFCAPCAANQMATELESQRLWDLPKRERIVHVRESRPAYYDDYY